MHHPIMPCCHPYYCSLPQAPLLTWMKLPSYSRNKIGHVMLMMEEKIFLREACEGRKEEAEETLRFETRL